VKFPRLFSLSEQKEKMISDLVVVPVDRSRLIWRRRLFHWKEERVGQLVELLREVRLTPDEDKWVWLLRMMGCSR
jgi:hypothetical protein